jgi:hypothetical protein
MSDHPDEIKAALAAERAKLGENAAARVRAVSDFISAQAGDKAGPVLATLTQASQIEAYERMMAQSRAQRSTPSAAPSPQPQAQPGQGKVTDEQWAKMPPRERLDYARKFDQTQFRQQAGRK